MEIAGKMIAAVFHKSSSGGGDIKLEEIDEPIITKKDQVKIRVMACGICGTDLKIASGAHPANDNIILGHEFAGIIEEVGQDIRDLQIGDKVAVDPNEYCGYCTYCRSGYTNLCEYMATGTTFGIFQHGGFAKHCVLPRNALFKLPREFNMTKAALVEPLSCAMHCHNLADVKESDIVAIIGAGPMGLIIESVIKTHPIKKLISIETDDWRREKALELGADHAINPLTQDVGEEIFNLTGGNGADVIIDAVGASETLEMATKIWSYGARVVCFGQDTRAETLLRPNEIVRYQRKILGSYIYNSKDILDAIDLIGSGRLDTSKLITKEIKLENLLLEGFQIMKEKKCVKIIVKP
ncbi:MAG: alcohol dehydrogenase catalytic domain-containing protein [Candidatus Lokiarchaeota archaeon]|nr:alcohol dehydrogenase catalytic domain-containing protein [Candidatus Lokiarchaeota archaeon]